MSTTTTYLVITGVDPAVDHIVDIAWDQDGVTGVEVLSEGEEPPVDPTDVLERLRRLHKKAMAEGGRTEAFEVLEPGIRDILKEFNSTEVSG